MRTTQKFRLGAISLLLAGCMGSAIGLVFVDEVKTEIPLASGVITEKYINSYACGEYQDQCYDKFIVVDKSAHLVSTSTYNAYSVGDSVKLSTSRTENYWIIAILRVFAVIFYAILTVFGMFLLLRTLHWMFFKSDTWKYKDYMKMGFGF